MFKPSSYFTLMLAGKVDEKATQLHAIASLKVLLDATKPQDGVNGNADGLHNAEGGDSGRATGSEVTTRVCLTHIGFIISIRGNLAMLNFHLR